MRDLIQPSHLILALVGCCLGGPCVGLSIRGDWYGVLGTVGCLPILWLCGNATDRISVVLGGGLFSLGFYTVSLDGLSFAMDGAFSRLLILLITILAFLHALFFLVLSRTIQSPYGTNWWIIPFACVAYEGARHMLLRSIDGSGMTMCSLGQGLASCPIFLQTSDLMGISLLSFLTMAIPSIVLAILDRRASPRQSSDSWTLFLFVSILLASLLYGGWRILSSPIPIAHGKAVVIGSRLTVLRIDRLRRQLKKVHEAESPEAWVAVFAPEGSLNWRDRNKHPRPNELPVIEDELRIQDALVSLSKEFDCYFVFGAWYQSEDDGQFRNSVVAMRAGDVLYRAEKQQPIPVAEGRVPFAEKLLPSELTDLVEINQLTQPQEPDGKRWLASGLPFVPGVCYDVFFPSTLRNYDVKTSQALAYCFDESFDLSGVFKEYLTLHSKIRCVENRKPMVKCSFGGDSVVIDSQGNLLNPLEVHEDVRSFLVPISNENSLYTWMGDWLSPICLVVFSIAIAKSFASQRRGSQT